MGWVTTPAVTRRVGRYPPTDGGPSGVTTHHGCGRGGDDPRARESLVGWVTTQEGVDPFGVVTHRLGTRLLEHSRKCDVFFFFRSIHQMIRYGRRCAMKSALPIIIDYLSNFHDEKKK